MKKEPKHDTVKIALRLIAMLVLIIIIIMDDFPFYEKMKDPATQLFLGVIVVGFIYYDAIFGFITGLVVLLIYYEIYKKIIAKEEQRQKLMNSQSLNGEQNTEYLTIPVIPNEFMGAHHVPSHKPYSAPSHMLVQNKPDFTRDTPIFVQPSISNNKQNEPTTILDTILSQPSIPAINGSSDPLKMDYISEAHLLAAQNNIFDVDCYKEEIKGVTKGLHDEKVYGAQGLDFEKVNYKGYNKSENIYSLLSKDGS
jgi:hypothetical protein